MEPITLRLVGAIMIFVGLFALVFTDCGTKERSRGKLVEINYKSIKINDIAVECKADLVEALRKILQELEGVP